MKYALLKNGEIRGFELINEDLDLIKYLSQFVNYRGKYAPIKQSFDLKDLSDIFVCERKDGSRAYLTWEELLPLRMCYVAIHGAVWTSRGLIFVTELDKEKGLVIYKDDDEGE